MNQTKSNIGYNLVPPDGGWGFIIILVVAITSLCTFLPIVTFGIIFEPFLESIGDKAGGVALIIGIYFAVQWTTGLAANILLQKMSYRKVGVSGAIITVLGLFSASFSVHLYQLILSFAVVQPFGYGLMFPAMLTAFNLYFDRRKAVAYNFINILIISITASFPSLASFLMRNFGYRGANAIQAAICLNCIPAMLCLQPVKWHLKKQNILSTDIKIQLKDERVHSANETEKLEQNIKLLSNGDVKISGSPKRDNEKTENAGSLPLWKSIIKTLDLGLFTDPIYVNIVIGVSLCLAADYTFLTAFPALLKNFQISSAEETSILTIFYMGDIVGRLILITITAFTKIKNRCLLLMGAVILVTVRTGFVMNDSFLWLAVCSALMGSVRCLFQTTFPLIFTELYTKRFVTAFSLFMIVCGIVSLLSGLIISWVNDVAKSNVAVIHSLSVMNLLCALPWIIEFLYYRIKRKH